MYTVFDPYFLKLSGPTSRFLPFIKQYGIGGVGVDSALLDEEEAALELAREVSGLGLSWGILFTPVDFYAPTTDDALFAKGLEVFKRRCAVAEKMGVKYCYNHVWSSNDQRCYEENFLWHIHRLEQVQQVCFDNGIFYGLEFLGPRDVLYRHPHEFIHSIAGVMALTEAAGGKAGFLFDTYHWYCEGARTDDLYFALTHVDKMCGFHVNDGVFGRGREYQRDMERAMPLTTGVIDAGTPYRLFEQAGYQGPVVCEPLYPAIHQAQDKSAEECVRAFAEAYARLSEE